MSPVNILQAGKAAQRSFEEVFMLFRGSPQPFFLLQTGEIMPGYPGGKEQE
jgi:hypothetical protein